MHLPAASPSSTPLRPASSRPLLLLASASPRRAQLLSSIGVPFKRVESSFQEPLPTSADNHAPQDYVRRLARGKATLCMVKSRHSRDAERVIILAADTVVWREGRIFNKPRDKAGAIEMLRTLQGQEHRVLTGVCLRILQDNRDDAYHVEHEATTVQFRAASDDWIARYVATGEPMDKAGSYAAQGLGATLIERIEGDYSNVVGLPLCRLSRMMQSLGAPIEEYWI